MSKWIDKEERQEQLFCTPPHVIKALLRREHFPGTIWEPAAGKGHIVSVLRQCGYADVVATDLNDWGFQPSDQEDFLGSQKSSDSLLTNPPFSLKLQFVAQAKRLVRQKIALLLPTEFEHTVLFVRHHESDHDFPWKALYSFPQAIHWKNVTEPWGKIKFGWFVFERGYLGHVIREKIVFRKANRRRASS